VYLRVFVRDVRLYLLLRLLLSSFRLHTDRPQNVSLLHKWKNMESRMTIDAMTTTTTTSMILMATAAISTTTTTTTAMRMNAAAAADDDRSQTSERDRRGIEPGDFGDA